MKPPGGECHDLFGAAFNGSPSHLRVLKPPGGGSSDIFGAGNDSSAADARRIRAKQQQSSQLFLGSTSCSIASSSSNSSSASSTASDHVDSHSNGVVSAPTNGVPAKKMHGNSASASSYQRLFGEYQIPATPSKNHMKSSIVLDDTDSGCGSKSGSSHSSTPERGNSPRESTKTSPRGSPPLRNPVTGDGCGATGRRQQSARRRDGNPVTGEGYEGSISKPSTPLSNGSSNPPSTPSSTATGRQRVPPGGFSSGLW